MGNKKKQIQIPDSRFQVLNSGMSLLEILVVIAIFAILGIIVTRSVVLSIGGSRKSESVVKVRENLNYSLAIIERQIRNANSISQCPNPDPTRIDYKDRDGNPAFFSCVNLGGSDPYIASGSARLTNDLIQVTQCSFTCVAATSTNPALVTVTLEAKDSGAMGVQNATVSTTTQIYLRNY